MNDIIKTFLKITIVTIIIWTFIGYLFDRYVIQIYELTVPFWILILLILSGFVFSVAICFTIIFEKYLWKQ